MTRVITDSHIHFEDVVVNISTPIEQIVEGNCGIFFELVHFKSKKSKNSCRCWTFMEADEITNGPFSLELYKKPADFKKKKGNIHLFSVKELFFHLRGVIRDDN